MAGHGDPYQLVTEVARLLGASEPRLQDYGATKAASLSIDGKAIEILHGRELAIEVGLRLPGFPSSVTVSFAPEGLYDRAKLLETLEPSAPTVTGCDAFDRLFVVLGEHHTAAISRLARAWSSMVDAAELRPSIEQLKLVPGAPPELRPHLRTRPAFGPATRAAGESRLPFAAEAVRNTVSLSLALERAWASGSGSDSSGTTAG